MILVRVSQRYNIQPMIAPRPQVGRHGFFAGIDCVALLKFLPGEAAERPATVNQQRLAPWRHHEERVSLPYVQNRHFELSCRPYGSKREQRDARRPRKQPRPYRPPPPPLPPLRPTPL